MNKHAFALLSALFAVTLMSSSAQAGGTRYYNDGPSFFLFDLFGQAPSSKYRRSNTKVYGYNKSVGGYSYSKEDIIGTPWKAERSYNPIYDRSPFDSRLGEGGVYLGD